eukprot:10486416-Lingulodinium_polyedra.AAC.1
MPRERTSALGLGGGACAWNNSGAIQGCATQLLSVAREHPCEAEVQELCAHLAADLLHEDVRALQVPVHDAGRASVQVDECAAHVETHLEPGALARGTRRT